MKSKSLQTLMEQLAKLPSIGSRTAERLALHIAKAKPEDVESLMRAIQSVRESIKQCKRCHFMAEADLCAICANEQRNQTQICVVENNADLMAIEKTKTYQGTYHVLEGVFAPLDGVGPSDINIGSMMNRLKNQDIREVIIATNPTANGEATANYIAKAIHSLGKSIDVSRIGFGVALGSELSYVDKFTMARSLEARTKLG